jgi:hypothetical protein
LVTPYGENGAAAALVGRIALGVAVHRRRRGVDEALERRRVALEQPLGGEHVVMV